MRRALRRVQTVLAPSRDDVPYLLATPTSYLLLVAFVATSIAKLVVFRRMEDIDFWFGQWLAAIAPDALVFFGLAALLAIAERRSRYVAFATVPISLFTTTLAAINAIYLSMTGEQLSAPVIQLGVERFDDVTTMAKASSGIGPAFVITGIVVLALPYVAINLYLRRKKRERGVTLAAVGRARIWFLAALVGGLVLVISPTPMQFGRLYRNASLHTVVELVLGERDASARPGLFIGYHDDLVDEASAARLREPDLPNIVVLVLESTRRDATSLGGLPSAAATPNLAALAATGLEVTHGRAVIPYTTKSLWSMMCGRLPLLQTKIYETSSALAVQCLPRLLAASGWRTGFLQSATARFEDRPRLVHEIGFREIMMAEQYTPLVLGYLSTDDEALSEQLAKWIDRAPDRRPFFATLLTSATHHPYMLTPGSKERAAASGAPTESDRDRYDRQIEAADHLLGRMLDVLRERHLLDHTIVVVVGDHGEGFGEKAVRQHALNYFEEGLRVPWVIAGPAVPHRRIDGNAMLPDLVPTLLELLGAKMSAGAVQDGFAQSVLSPIADDRVVIFSCFFEKSCNGFVRGHEKVVQVPETGDSFMFDLASDPNERSPQRLSAVLERARDEVQRTVDAHRTKSWPKTYPQILEYLPWVCPAGLPCGIPIGTEATAP